MPYKKHNFTPDDDYDRLAERINNEYAHNIQDFDSFERAYKSYLADIDPNSKLLTNMKLLEKTYKALRKKRGTLPDLSLFKKAGGKNYEQDVKTTAKEVTTSKEEYVKKGAQHIDYKGLDTKKEAFVLVGYIRGKVVRARKTHHTQNRRQITVYRDSRGRFVKVR